MLGDLLVLKERELKRVSKFPAICNSKAKLPVSSKRHITVFSL
jgi:hypothetical protein